MIIKCIRNTSIRGEEYSFAYNPFSDIVEHGELEIGEEYIVMGMILKKGAIYYLINSGTVISASPYILFQITNHSIPNNWYFKIFTPDYYNYINMEAVWGYFELCFVDKHYEELIDMNRDAHRIYFSRKNSQLSENLE
jgi:hypothetical protein